MFVDSDTFRHHAPHSDLEKLFITNYLNEKGYSRQELNDLPKEQSHRFMVEACRYASLKLAEIESRAQFKKKIQFER